MISLLYFQLLSSGPENRTFCLVFASEHLLGIPELQKQLWFLLTIHFPSDSLFPITQLLEMWSCHFLLLPVHPHNETQTSPVHSNLTARTCCSLSSSSVSTILVPHQDAHQAGPAGIPASPLSTPTHSLQSSWNQQTGPVSHLLKTSECPPSPWESNPSSFRKTHKN